MSLAFVKGIDHTQRASNAENVPSWWCHHGMWVSGIWSCHEYRKVSNIRRTKYQNLNDSRIILQLSLPNALKSSVKSKNEDVVGAAPIGDAPTTSEWSTILLPSQVRLILEIWRYSTQGIGIWIWIWRNIWIWIFIHEYINLAVITTDGWDNQCKSKIQSNLWLFTIFNDTYY